MLGLDSGCVLMTADAHAREYRAGSDEFVLPDHHVPALRRTRERFGARGDGTAHDDRVERLSAAHC